MILSDAIKEMVHRSGLTQKKLAERAGYKYVGSVTMPIANNNTSISTLYRLADAAGYDVMLVRRSPIEPEYPIKIDGYGREKEE